MQEFFFFFIMIKLIGKFSFLFSFKLEYPTLEIYWLSLDNANSSTHWISKKHCIADVLPEDGNELCPAIFIKQKSTTKLVSSGG